MTMLASLNSSLLLLVLLFQSAAWAAIDPPNLRRLNQGNTDESSSSSRDPGDGNRNLIVGGEEAQANEFPWFASMLRHSKDEQPGCGGTLISPNRVLTAAHCMEASRFFPELGPPAYVRVGHTTHHNGEVIPVDCVTIHPSYITLYNDLAIVKLARNVTAVSLQPTSDSAPEDSIVPLILTLAPATQAATTTTAFATLNKDTAYPSTNKQELTSLGFGAPAGWVALLGTVLTLGRIPKTKRLQKLSTNFLTEDKCREEYVCADAKYYACAKSDSDENTGVCYGDSGGPLLDSNNVVIGVTSFKGGGGYGCAEGFPDIYMNVANYQEWIQREIESDTCDAFAAGATDFRRPCWDS